MFLEVRNIILKNTKPKSISNLKKTKGKHSIIINFRKPFLDQDSTK
jgi:hypothetical protein